ncbi:MAG: hypothetical protein AAGI46_16675 [Planctomycetota bacterium]
MSDTPAFTEPLEARRLLVVGPSEVFLTDGQLEFGDSMTVPEVRAFLQDQGSYFRVPRLDVDGSTFDLAQVVVDAGLQYDINPQVLLTTLQKEHSGITRTTRPTESQMAFLMGSGTPSTARLQFFDAAERKRAYLTELDTTGFTRSGWQVGVAKQTQDNIFVAPANRATAGQFTYTPFAGVQWGGSLSQVGGVWLFANWWEQFGFNDRAGPEATLGFNVDGADGPILTVEFDERVVGLSAGDMQLFTTTGGFLGFSPGIELGSDGKTATFDIPDFLPPGTYIAQLPARAVTDGALNVFETSTTLTFDLLPGDANQDRRVDLVDFGIFRSNFGETGLFSDGDFNYDGQITLADFGILRGNFGVNLGSSSVSLFADDEV